MPIILCIASFFMRYLATISTSYRLKLRLKTSVFWIMTLNEIRRDYAKMCLHSKLHKWYIPCDLPNFTMFVMRVLHHGAILNGTLGFGTCQIFQAHVILGFLRGYMNIVIGMLAWWLDGFLRIVMDCCWFLELGREGCDNFMKNLYLHISLSVIQSLHFRYENDFIIRWHVKLRYVLREVVSNKAWKKIPIIDNRMFKEISRNLKLTHHLGYENLFSESFLTPGFRESAFLDCWRKGWCFWKKLNL